MLNHALKEWSIAVEALTQGQTVLLLRKGGIREVGNHFQVPYQRVWLYPTYEHQKSHLLKPQWANRVNTVTSGWHPNHITLQAWADISYVWTVKDSPSVESLLPFHIWNEQFIAERFRWKPSQLLHLLVLRVHRLIVPITIDWQIAHGGCRSWLTLDNPLETMPSVPVLDEREFTTAVQKIHDQITLSDVSEP